MNCPTCGSPLGDDAVACQVCGTLVMEISDHVTPRATRRLLPPGTVVGAYVIEGVVGEGGMSVVYRARDRVLGRVVALKALHSNLLGDDDLRRRFLREARLMRTWSHPHVATVYDVVDSLDVLAAVMELVPGQSLAQELRAWKDGLPLADVRQLGLGLAAGLGAAHAHGVVHRDVKPGNVLVVRDGPRLHPKLIDFGVAKVLEGTVYTLTGALLGTCRYMAPEQIERPDEIDARADLYALGITLYEAAVGAPPFTDARQFALMMAQVHRAPPPPSQRRADLPPAFERLLLELLAKDPDDRPQTAEDAAARLVEALAAVPEPAPPEPADLPERVDRSEGGQLVLVPAGDFLHGPDKRPVWLDAFYIDRFPVTNRQFQLFLRTTGYRAGGDGFLAHWRDGRPPAELLDHPVVHVSWDDARAYATWAGLRLPTDAEWEKAARGVDGRRYPWGRANPEARHANWGRRVRGTTAVDAHPDGASPYGVLDLAGNVWEWVQDADDEAFYVGGPTVNPVRRGEPDARRVARGGAWVFDDPKALRTITRGSFDPTERSGYLGFRCARDC